MIDLSLGEYRALVAKAFRGAGYTWGLTEDAAFAAKRLAEFDLPSAELVVALLDSVDGRSLADVMAGSPVACPVCFGVSIADLDEIADTTLQVLSPLLFLPLIAPALAKHGGVYRLDWEGGAAEASSTAFASSGTTPNEATTVTVRHRPALTLTPRVGSRAKLTSAMESRLGAYAHRTYAPATEASRDGAGPS